MFMPSAPCCTHVQNAAATAQGALADGDTPLWLQTVTTLPEVLLLDVSLNSLIVYLHAPQWGTWKSGVSLINTGIRHPSSVMKNVIPIVMAGGEWIDLALSSSYGAANTTQHTTPIHFRSVIGIYGLIIAVILAESIPSPALSRENTYSIYTGMAHLCAGLCCGLSGLAAGGCIGIVGEYGVRCVGYRASNITLFPTKTEEAGYSSVSDHDQGNSSMGHSHIHGSSPSQNV